MANSVTVKLSGFEELEQTLRDGTKKMAVKFLRGAEKSAGKIWQEAIANRAPVDTGHLAESIKIKTEVKSGDNGSMTMKVGPDQSAFYGVFQEFGTKDQPARPFMRPAFEETKDEVLEALVTECKNRLEDLKKK